MHENLLDNARGRKERLTAAAVRVAVGADPSIKTDAKLCKRGKITRDDFARRVAGLLPGVDEFTREHAAARLLAYYGD